MLICCCLLNTIIVIVIEFWDSSWSLLCYSLVLVLGIGIAIGQYYWVLDIGCLSWYRSNPTMLHSPYYVSMCVEFRSSFSLRQQRQLALSFSWSVVSWYRCKALVRLWSINPLSRLMLPELSSSNNRFKPSRYKIPVSSSYKSLSSASMQCIGRNMKSLEVMSGRLLILLLFLA